MPNVVIIGAQWGDEGKAKIIDYLSEKSDVIIRFQGGANAGHTVVVDKHKFIFHMVPSGIMYPGKICILGNGIVFDADQFLAEVEDLGKNGISSANRLFISDLAHLVLPFHKTIDIARESAMKANKIGTTGRGIGPAYADKATRIGIRVGDLRDWSNFTTKLETAYQEKKFIIEQVYKYPIGASFNEICANFKAIREKILPQVRDTSSFIHECMRQGKSLLFEGAQGTLLDIDHGTYPYVTSSNTIAAAACLGSGVGPRAIDHVVGIVKAYTTRVGNGPFPTEQDNDLGTKLRKEGAEFGATTGRPRRCGWFDSVMLRKAIQLNGFTRMALTKLDVLNSFDEVKICTHYELHGKKIEYIPNILSELENVVPIYETYPGWKSDICECKKYSDLPDNALKYIQKLQDLCYDLPLLLVSVGPERNQTIEVVPLS